MTHTYGTWKLDWLKSMGCNIDPEDGHGRIATVWVRYTKTDNLAETEANARLIASAPELLEACKLGLGELRMVSTMAGSINFEIHKKLEEAIAKAEGSKK